jgi:FlaA1/EpsC-like NDP-sugar epimerase
MSQGRSKTTKTGEALWFLRRPGQIAGDIAILSLAFIFSYIPAVNFQIDDFYLDLALLQVPLVVLIQFSSLFLFGAYNIIWRYIGLSDLRVFAKAAVASVLILLSLRFFAYEFLTPAYKIPVSVILIDTALGFGGILTIRILRRIVYEMGIGSKPLYPSSRRRNTPTLVIGAGRLGSLAVREIVTRKDSGLEIKGFIDDDAAKIGGSVAGIKVLGATGDLPRFVSDMSIEQVVIAINQTSGTEIRRIFDLCQSLNLRARMLPSIGEIAGGQVQISRVRDVEIEDLLGRDEIVLEEDLLPDFLRDKTVLVTGAGGSIGSELVRQCLQFNPKKILLVERAEFLLFEIDREVRKLETSVEAIPMLADIGDRVRMNEIFATYKPDVVFHAAAHKHVPLMETNMTEAIKNNVIASRILGEIAGEHGVKDFVLISTDKAVNPTSVMGASKRIAEIVLQDLNRKFETNFIAVRFGNVLGSAGSVIPIFKDQIKSGGPVTVTDPEMTRYFMTMPEAARLVMHAGALGQSGEIFILDMGRPVRILQLAEDLIRLSGFEPYADIDIAFTGIRKGEKLFEELEISGEDLLKTRHPKIFIGKIASYEESQVNLILDTLESAASASDVREIRSALSRFIPESSLFPENTSPLISNTKLDDETGDGSRIPDPLAN